MGSIDSKRGNPKSAVVVDVVVVLVDEQGSWTVGGVFVKAFERLGFKSISLNLLFRWKGSGSYIDGKGQSSSLSLLQTNGTS